MAKQKNIIRSNIKYLFIHQLNKTSTVLDIGLLTDDFKYFDCQIRYSGDNLSLQLQYKLQKAFYPFQFTSKTDIMYSDTLPTWNPIIRYLHILSSQFLFKMRKTSHVNIPRRITSLHKSYGKHVAVKDVNMYDIKEIWRKIVKNNRCPWITEDVDKILATYRENSTFCRRKKFIRLALYYMLVKQHLYYQTKKYSKKIV